jgi:hypothetical protein
LYQFILCHTSEDGWKPQEIAIPLGLKPGGFRRLNPRLLMSKPSKMFNHMGKPLVIDRAMIELRDRLAAACGYVKRPCSLGPDRSGHHRECWERTALDMEYHGQMVSSFHAVPMREESDAVIYFWPPKIMDAARAIDGEHRARKKPAGDD